MSIKAIFYSKFDTVEGPKVIHQVPEDSIVSSTDLEDGPPPTPFIPFSAISSFIIPRQSLCGNLTSVIPPSSSPQLPSYLVLGYPICLTNPSYPRNEFIFNFCLVLSTAEAVDVNAYKSVVTKLAHLMRSLEEQSYFLSNDTSAPGTGKLYSVCEMLMEDLNNYCECMIPIDDLNTLNIKLFPTYSPPPRVKAWHVPIFTVRPETLMDENWDLTMQRIVPHINGVSSVKRIAFLADADLSLTRRCVKHLLYYGCLLLLDIFSFSAIYAPTAEFSRTIASDHEMQCECARYVNTAFAPTSRPTAETATQPDMPSNGNSTNSLSQRSTSTNTTINISTTNSDIWPLSSTKKPLSGVSIVQLFAALRQGQSVREWYTANSNLLANIDMRRFITFGVIKGFLYRIHKYAIAIGNGTTAASLTMPAHAVMGMGIGVTTKHGRPARHQNQNHRTTTSSVQSVSVVPATGLKTTTTLPRSMSSELHLTEEDELYPPDPVRIRRRPPQAGTGSRDDDNSPDPDSDSDPTATQARLLGKYLDGTHCFDQICTELEISENEMLRRLKMFPGEVLVVHR